MTGVILFMFGVTSIAISPSYAIPFKGVNNYDFPDPLPKAVEPVVTYEYDKAEESKQFWSDQGQNTLKQKLDSKQHKGIAKNVIMFLGDGLSIPTQTAARIFLGQQSKKPGEETVLSFENFPYSGLSKTYCVDRQVADSACSATAYLNGIKGNIRTIGVTAAVKLRDCKAQNVADYHTESIGVWAQSAGKTTGFVTTSRVTHASPAGLYAHIANRDWESDTMVMADDKDPTECVDIARQLIEDSPGKNLKVVLGGGRQMFMLNNQTDPEYSNKIGNRTDGRNLIQSWLEHKKTLGAKASYVWNKEDMLKANDSEYILGLFEPSHMLYHLEANPKTEPTLEEMTETAINILSKGTEGYFLFVEGAKIDMAHHDAYAKMSLDETVEFAKAVSKAVELTNEEDTLIVVTADHAHTMTISGYPARGRDILTNLQITQSDGLPYSTLNYANGPGFKRNTTDPTSRYNLFNDKDKMNDKYYRFPATVPILYETHGGDDVAVFARGPWAHLFSGCYEQSYIPYVMGYAARIGPTGNVSMPSRSGPAISHSLAIVISCSMITLLSKQFIK